MTKKKKEKVWKELVLYGSVDPMYGLILDSLSDDKIYTKEWSPENDYVKVRLYYEVNLNEQT